jgi:hypothetical protein
LESDRAFAQKDRNRAKHLSDTSAKKKSKGQENLEKQQQTATNRIFNALWLNSELEFRFRSSRLHSFELMVQALDCLSRTASRYGLRGKKVFEVNRHPIVSAIQLFECLPFMDAEREFAKLLRARLEAMPEFDPEGWALRLVA